MPAGLQTASAKHSTIVDLLGNTRGRAGDTVVRKVYVALGSGSEGTGV